MPQEVDVRFPFRSKGSEKAFRIGKKAPGECYVGEILVNGVRQRAIVEAEQFAAGRSSFRADDRFMG